MQARVQKWGNSLAVRIPKSIATQSQLGKNTLVEMSLEEGIITLVPVLAPPVTLEQLLEGVSPDNLHGEIATGDAVGREVW